MTKDKSAKLSLKIYGKTLSRDITWEAWRDKDITKEELTKLFRNLSRWAVGAIMYWKSREDTSRNLKCKEHPRDTVLGASLLLESWFPNISTEELNRVSPLLAEEFRRKVDYSCALLAEGFGCSPKSAIPPRATSVSETLRLTFSSLLSVFLFRCNHRIFPRLSKEKLGGME
jgi:hypothetical protein